MEETYNTPVLSKIILIKTPIKNILLYAESWPIGSIHNGPKIWVRATIIGNKENIWSILTTSKSLSPTKIITNNSDRKNVAKDIAIDIHIITFPIDLIKWRALTISSLIKFDIFGKTESTIGVNSILIECIILIDKEK